MCSTENALRYYAESLLPRAITVGWKRLRILLLQALITTHTENGTGWSVVYFPPLPLQTNMPASKIKTVGSKTHQESDHLCWNWVWGHHVYSPIAAIILGAESACHTAISIAASQLGFWSLTNYFQKSVQGKAVRIDPQHLFPWHCNDEFLLLFPLASSHLGQISGCHIPRMMFSSFGSSVKTGGSK